MAASNKNVTTIISRDEFSLNDEEKHILEILRGAKGKYASNYSDEESQAICDAVHSGNQFLKNEATLLVHEGLEYFEETFMKHFGITKQSSYFNDYKQELSLTILENLPDWNPEKGKLTTYFQVYFKNTCTKTHNKTSTFKSRHYENVNVDITKAMNALEQEGNLNPSPIEIRDYMTTNMGRTHSERTISNCLEQRVEITSYDATKELFGNGLGSDPLTQVLANERRQEVVKCIESLEPQHRIIMEIELKMYDTIADNSRKIKISGLTEECKKLISTAKPEWIKSLKVAAEREFSTRMKKILNRNDAPVTHTYKSSEYLKQLKEDIEMAASENLDALFADMD